MSLGLQREACAREKALVDMGTTVPAGFSQPCDAVLVGHRHATDPLKPMQLVLSADHFLLLQ